MRIEDVSWEAWAGWMLQRRGRLAAISPNVNPLLPFGHRPTEADLTEAEARLGHALDAQHVELLRRVNGWPNLFASGDLLGTGDLGQGARWAYAQQMITAFYEEGPAIGFPPRDAVYPIHLGESDLFVIDMAGPVTDGGHPVHWLDGSVVDTWPNVREYWRAGLRMLDIVQEYYERNSAPSNGGNGFTPIRLDPDAR